MDKILLGATIPNQSGPGNDGNRGVLCIPQSSCITGAPTSDCLMSYPEQLLVESYTSAEMQSDKFSEFHIVFTVLAWYA